MAHGRFCEVRTLKGGYDGLMRCRVVPGARGWAAVAVEFGVGHVGMLIVGRSR